MNGAVPMLAIDGPSGAGKGTVAGLLARRLGWNLLDSGALYRLLAFAAVNHGVDLTNEEALKVLAAHLDVQFVAADGSHGQRIILEGEEVTDVIRTEQVGAGAHRSPPYRPCAMRCCSASGRSSKRRGWWPTAATWAPWYFPMRL